MKRLFDVIFSIFGILLFIPFFLIFGLLIILEDGFPVFFRQQRIGKNGIPFTMLKLRSMKKRKIEGLPITVGGKDSRVLKVGYFIRKYKLDEFPQLINVLVGQMSLVGPRPEVKKYVDLYTKDQWAVLHAKPGITDIASIEFKNENELLQSASDPEMYYIEEIMPKKIRLNMLYINDPTLNNYFKVIIKTLLSITK